MGRASERRQLRALLDAAIAGDAGVLVVSGEAGIGKSVLLDDLCAEARQAQSLVLRARGVESESQLSYAGLADVLRPLEGSWDDLPDVRRAALDAALGRGPAVPTIPFAVGVATLAVLSGAAEETPILVAVDDAHWLDEPSRDALLFAFRRLHHDAVAAVLCERTGAGIATVPQDVERMELAGLDLPAVRALVEEAIGESIDEATAEHVAVATAGNPLAIAELARGGAAALRAALSEEHNLPVPRTLAHAFRARLDPLPDATRRALLVVAASRSGAVDEIHRALEAFDLDVAALEPAEQAELVGIAEGTWRLLHPLLRSQILREAGDSARADASGALAAAAPSGSEDQVWYRAVAVKGTDAEAADALAQVAANTMLLGGPRAAAPAFLKAARITPPGPARAGRLVVAAECCLASGRIDEVRALLDEASGSAADPMVGVQIASLRGLLEIYGGSPEVGLGTMAHAAREIADVNPDGAAVLLALACWPAMMSGRVPFARQLGQEAVALTRDRPGPAADLSFTLSTVAAIADADVSGVGAEFMRLSQCSPWRDVLGPTQLVPSMAISLFWIEEYAAAERTVSDVIAEARRRENPAELPFHLGTRATIEWVTGRWIEAAADADEASELARSTNQALMIGFAETQRLFGQAGRGIEPGPAQEEEIDAAARLGAGTLSYLRHHALGLLALGLGRFSDATASLLEAQQSVPDGGARNPTVARHFGDLIEALIREDRVAEASEIAGELAAVLEEAPSRFGTALLARSRALLAADRDDAEEHFLAAIDAPGAAEIPFDTARAELLYGEWLRRRRRYRDARVHLQRAFDVLARLGAVPWADRAAAELRASGGGDTTPRSTLIDTLTPQELRVALAVAEGRTNREVASDLFLSPKTVEFHLGKAFRKLGIRSRVDLARVMTSATNRSILEPAPEGEHRAGGRDEALDG